MKRKPRGSTFLEVSISATLLAVAFMAIAQLLAAAGGQQRAAERQRLATREAANLMERVMARPWSEITSDSVAALTLSDEAERGLPGVRMNVWVVVLDEEPAAKRIRVEIDWANKAGQRGRPVRLVAWKHRGQQAE